MRIFALSTILVLSVTHTAFATIITMDFSGTWSSVYGDLAKTEFTSGGTFEGKITYSTNTQRDSTSTEHVQIYEATCANNIRCFNFNNINTVDLSTKWKGYDNSPRINVNHRDPLNLADHPQNEFSIKWGEKYNNLDELLLPDSLSSRLYTAKMIIGSPDVQLSSTSLPDFGLSNDILTNTEVDPIIVGYNTAILNFYFFKEDQFGYKTVDNYVFGNIDSISVTGEYEPIPTPEPTTAILFGSGVIALGFRFRRKKA